MTPFQQHVEKWKGCQRCPLYATRTWVVFCRGKIPADVLFVGEAPGASEDALGKPFKGPAGSELDLIIANALDGLDNVRTCFTNLIGCVPLHEGKKEAPEDNEIQACLPKLAEFIKLAEPKLIVAVGKLAEDYLPSDGKRFKHQARLHRPIPVVGIIHPAAILRASPAHQGLLRRKAEVAIRTAVEGLLCQK